MAAIFKILIMLALLLSTVRSGPLTYAVCVAACNAAWAACLAAAGVLGVPACNAAYGACVSACAIPAAVPVLL